MQNLDEIRDPRLLSDPKDFGDAGIFQLDDGRCLVQSVDFFSPMVDDPEVFGRIAAANALSDLYACGAEPLTAMNIVAFPDDQLDMSILSAILRGASDAVRESGAVSVGGHSIRDQEIKFGLAVTGIANVDSLVSNTRARPGDVLVLTKPLGTGILTTAVKKGACEPSAIEAAVESMSRLNRIAAAIARKHGVLAATDITGFGLAGHATELANASQVTLSIDSNRLGALPGAIEAIESGITTRGQQANKQYYGEQISIADTVSPQLQQLIFDPQTSGGLLLCVPSSWAAALMEDLYNQGERAMEIGHVVRRRETAVLLV